MVGDPRISLVAAGSQTGSQSGASKTTGTAIKTVSGAGAIAGNGLLNGLKNSNGDDAVSETGKASDNTFSPTKLIRTAFGDKKALGDMVGQALKGTLNRVADVTQPHPAPPETGTENGRGGLTSIFSPLTNGAAGDGRGTESLKNQFLGALAASGLGGGSGFSVPPVMPQMPSMGGGGSGSPGGGGSSGGGGASGGGGGVARQKPPSPEQRPDAPKPEGDNNKVKDSVQAANQRDALIDQYPTNKEKLAEKVDKLPPEKKEAFNAFSKVMDDPNSTDEQKKTAAKEFFDKLTPEERDALVPPNPKDPDEKPERKPDVIT